MALKEGVALGILTFKKGGVKPLHNQHEGKPLASGKMIQELEAPKLVAIPMAQNIGMPAHPCVKVGDTVCVGQPIGRICRRACACQRIRQGEGNSGEASRNRRPHDACRDRK